MKHCLFSLKMVSILSSLLRAKSFPPTNYSRFLSRIWYFKLAPAMMVSLPTRKTTMCRFCFSDRTQTLRGLPQRIAPRHLLSRSSSGGGKSRGMFLRFRSSQQRIWESGVSRFLHGPVDLLHRGRLGQRDRPGRSCWFCLSFRDESRARSWPSLRPPAMITWRAFRTRDGWTSSIGTSKSMSLLTHSLTLRSWARTPTVAFPRGDLRGVATIVWFCTGGRWVCC